MNKKSSTIFVALFLCTILCLVWSRAQTETPNVAPPDQTSDASGDKWQRIVENNKQMEKTLAEIELNLQFVKARSMSGGRNP
jgi:hypothetical protein